MFNKFLYSAPSRVTDRHTDTQNKLYHVILAARARRGLITRFAAKIMNVTKCKYMGLSSKHHPIYPSHHLAINGAPIEYLGVYLLVTQL